MDVQVPRRTRYSPIGVQHVLGALLVAAWSVCGGLAEERTAAPRWPFFDLRTHQPEYVGPAGPRTTADQLSEIRIGYFGPGDPEHPQHGNLWRAAQRAVEDANRDGGLEGKPFRLLPVWSDDPWGSGVTQLAQLVYRDRVWAIVGGVDGPTTHLAEQIVVKARLALVSPVSTDKTVNLTNVPWIFSLAPSDRRVADVLAPEIARRTRARTLILLSTNDHDAFLLTRELRRALTALDIVPRYQFEYPSPSQASAALVRECLDAKPDTVVVVANAPDSLQLVRALREAGFAGCIFGSPACGRDLFVRNAAALAGELIFPRLDADTSPPAPQHPALDQNVPCEPVETDGQEDYASRHVYDAVRLVTRAIEKAGLNRAAIARAVRDLSPMCGVSGSIEWDRPGSNMRRPTLATFVDGQIVPLDSLTP
ncbi:MAG: ABC transporter substrate-binding protein [Pirellulaceae bacterium]